MRRLFDEGSQVRSGGGCTKEGVSFAQAQDMPYLQACIKEGGRFHAATGLPLWRVGPEGGAEVCVPYFPGGSVVGISKWVAHYSQEVISHDAGKFRSGRWLGMSAEHLRAMGSYLMAFGVGSKTYIGRHISMLEISKLLPVVVQNFELKWQMARMKTLNH